MILVIDDNAEFAAIVEIALRGAGFEVLVASSSQDGLALIRGHPVTLVLTDVVMPQTDGIETLLILKQEHPALPVIVMSGDSPRYAPLYLTAAEKLGARCTLKKPFSASTLVNAVRDVLRAAPPKAG